jgi:hypothetical protein
MPRELRIIPLIPDVPKYSRPPLAVLDVRQSEYGGCLGANIAAGGRVLRQVDAVGRDEGLEWVAPAAGQFVCEAFLQNLECDEG